MLLVEDHRDHPVPPDRVPQQAGPLLRDVDGCVFCEIVADDLPGQPRAGDRRLVAFLDIRPVFKAHGLLVRAPTS